MKSKFEFCPMCKTPMEFMVPEHDEFERNACPKCGYVDYNNSRPTGSGLILNDKDQVLLVERAWHPFKGYWDIAGGFLEPGEHPEDGVKREIMEELRVEVEVKELFTIEVDAYVDDGEGSEENTSGYGVPTLNLYYLCRIISGEPNPTEEIAGYKWFDLGEIAGMIDQVAFSANKKVLEKLCNSRS